MVREIKDTELDDLLELYLHLHEESIPEMSDGLKSTWDAIQNDVNHHIIIKEVDGKIVSSCVCVIIPNLTRGVRPYAFVENVVTHKDYRGRGYARAICNAVLGKGKSMGATYSYLQVVKNNSKAVSLYESLGYRLEYSYWFRKK